MMKKDLDQIRMSLNNLPKWFRSVLWVGVVLPALLLTFIFLLSISESELILAQIEFANSLDISAAKQFLPVLEAQQKTEKYGFALFILSGFAAISGFIIWVGLTFKSK